MNTSTAQIEVKLQTRPWARQRAGDLGCQARTWRASVILLLLVVASAVQAAPVLGPWVPMFKGIDHATGTNTPSTAFPELQVIHCLRVDLTDPDVQLYASPRYTNYLAGWTETAGYTTTNFLRNHGLQVAINAGGFFQPGSTVSPSYTLAEGTAFNASGLVISQGVVVSPEDDPSDASTLMFGTNNAAVFVATNWPAQSTAGIYTAVTGPYTVLANGVNVGSNYIGSTVFVHGLNPRTAMGLSQDRRYLYLLVIDGRQSGYSDGAYDWELAGWLLLAGAWDGANMDGGGSTCMVVMESTRHPLELNRDVASLADGRERTVGAHFGVYAKPLPGFFTNVVALPDDTAATITWTTAAPASTQVAYGLTTNMTLTTVLDSVLVTNHAVLLTNLAPGTEYYFALHCANATTQCISPTYAFMTTNYVTTNQLFDFTNVWTYTRANLDGVNWKARSYDDSGWDGSGPGLLWVDYRGPNAAIPVPLMTQMPANPNTTPYAYPYTTYYVRTHFAFTNPPAGVSLQFVGYIDDGAAFYLNGTEIYRFNMPAAPAAIYNATFATGLNCSGDATCPTPFTLSGPILLTNLIQGDNVLAAEAHNYKATSSDVTFGLSAGALIPYVLNPRLNLSYSNSAVVLDWTRGGFILQQADDPAGPWVNVAGPVVSSPFTADNSSAARFYRLSK